MFKKNEKFASRLSRDSGLGLVEVVVAIALIMIVATASATLSIQAVNSTASQERRQLAVTIANSTLESIAATPVDHLLDGRVKAAVDTAFAANSGVSGVANTYRGVDPNATPLPITVAIGPVVQPPQSGTKFSITTLIGQCFESTAQASNPPLPIKHCGLVSGYANTTAGPTTAPSGYAALKRIIVIVSWTAGKTCGVTACYYAVSTVVDPNPELTWIIN